MNTLNQLRMIKLSKLKRIKITLHNTSEQFNFLPSIKLLKPFRHIKFWCLYFSFLTFSIQIELKGYLKELDERSSLKQGEDII